MDFPKVQVDELAGLDEVDLYSQGHFGIEGMLDELTGNGRISLQGKVGNVPVSASDIGLEYTGNMLFSGGELVFGKAGTASFEIGIFDIQASSFT